MTAAPSSVPRAFDVDRFEQLRAQRALAWGAPLVYTRETGSTNDDALAAARAGASHGTVFLADHQTRGRGRRGKTWVAEPGRHLLFSILLRDPPAHAGPGAAPRLPTPSDTPSIGALTLAVGLGVRDALAAQTDAALTVKWPNDVLAGARKLAGILCEGQFAGPRLDALVLGIGINVSHADYPAELQGHVACLQTLTPARPLPPRELLLTDLLAAIQTRVHTYLQHGFAPLLPDFTRHDALAGEPIEVSGASPLTGLARGVDPSGRLLIETDGLIVPIISGTVRRLPR